MGIYNINKIKKAKEPEEEYNNGYEPADDPDYRDECIIGIIDFTNTLNGQEIQGTKRLDLGNQIGQCKVEVYSGEGDIPHFHIIGTNFNFGTCIRIYSPEYFLHGKYKDILNNKQCKVLNKWMKEKNALMDKYTNWDITRLLFENCNQECNFPNNKKVTTQPDYTKLNK